MVQQLHFAFRADQPLASISELCAILESSLMIFRTWESLSTQTGRREKRVWIVMVAVLLLRTMPGGQVKYNYDEANMESLGRWEAAKWIRLVLVLHQPLFIIIIITTNTNNVLSSSSSPTMFVHHHRREDATRTSFSAAITRDDYQVLGGLCASL